MLSAVKIRYSRFHHRSGPVELIRACFSATKFPKFSFHNCRGRVMLVDVGLSAGKIR